MNEKILRISRLSIIYGARRGFVKAVRDVSLDLYRGECLALVGESGSGKTTLALSIVRALPTNAKIVSGNVYYHLDNNKEVDITKLTEDEMRKIRWREIAMVFQGSMNAFNPVLKIGDHFIETAKAHRFAMDKNEIIEKASNLLSLVLLDAKRVLNSYPHQLSGGMKQRTLIALSLLLNPKIIIMDEPTSALDVVSQKVVLNALSNIKKELNLSMIFITHDLGITAEVADRVSVMYAGQIVEIGNVFEMYYDPLHPYTQGLLKAIPRLRGSVNITSIPGSPPDLINLPPGCSFHPRCPFAMDVCRREEPPMIEVDKNRFVKCWLYMKK
ncbi:ABC transporter ATP-binding protein [Ignisphaera sp. 4213-co]|uniref:ABC transporter ATP-binding protein n=1 Tax=Ignisphaera cupida TaxID=3050454 RepID=A0ABD4Z468_9CREN|nr:ABC transporter ATP-binding protein [Ignisphaera sp. 4213-co]MDK6028111.1 ABC transporter ATP-binding protein [Ignisphaera sp. 4213-co]